MRKLLNQMKARSILADQNKESDSGDGILLFAFFAIPVVLLVSGLALDVMKNVYLKNSYQSMAESASLAAGKYRNAQGFVGGQLYLSQFGLEYDKLRGGGTRYSSFEESGVETSAFRSSRCNTVNDDMFFDELDPTVNPNIDVRSWQFPIQRYTIKNSVTGEVTSSGTWARGGPSLDNRYNINGFGDVIEVTVLESSGNLALGMFGRPCQGYASTVQDVPTSEHALYNRSRDSVATRE